MKAGFVHNVWKVWGLIPLSKSYGSGYTEIRSGNRRSYPKTWTYRPNQIMRHHGRSTHEGAPPLKRTPPYSCFEGNPTYKSKTSSPGAHRERAWKRHLHGWENSHHSGAVQQPLQQDLCSKFPLSCGLRGQEAITLPTSLFSGVTHQGLKPIHFYEQGLKAGARVYQTDVLQGVVKQLNTTVFSGQKWIFQQNSAPAHQTKVTQKWLQGTFRPLSAPRIGPRGVQTSPPWTINCGLFWRTWLAESATRTWTAWRDLSWKQRQRSLWRRYVPR